VIGRSLRLACAETAEITAQAVLKVLHRQKDGPAREAYSTGWTGAAAGGRDLEILFPLDIDIKPPEKGGRAAGEKPPGREKPRPRWIDRGSQPGWPSHLYPTHMGQPFFTLNLRPGAGSAEAQA
jgi:hypothetical protein